MSRHKASLALAVILGCLSAGPAALRAEDCAPLRMAVSVPMAYDQSGRPLVPVTIGSTKKYMLVDTGGALSMIGKQVVDQLGLSHEKVPIEQYGVNGQYTDEAADVAPFSIGNLTAAHMQFMIDPDAAEFGGETAGIIGPTILRFYDADFDFGANKFNLMMQDHCPGKVIYWQTAGVAAVPIRVAKAIGHIVVPVTLDGQKLNALIDTGASHTFITARIAESTFGLKLNTPDAPDVGSLKGQTASRIYRHTFRSLELEGIAINNPTMTILPDLNRSRLSHGPALGSRLQSNDEAPGLEDITIGVDVLKHLHVYIAYKEQMLYATPAGAPPAAAPAPTATGGETATPHAAMIVRPPAMP